MKIRKITILAGKDKDGRPEKFEKIEIYPGQTLSIVGPTGSGKSSFINDIELLADRDTATGRSILINGRPPTNDMKEDPAKKPIVLITQHTTFLAELYIDEFLQLHTQARKIREAGIVEKTIDLANKLTGEKVSKKMKMTELSGGQTRALMIADAIVIGRSPIILLDEVENAGIFKDEVLKIIKMRGKIVLFVTHDPVIAILCDYRIVMKNGSLASFIVSNAKEKKAKLKLMEHDLISNIIRERIRNGQIINI